MYAIGQDIRLSKTAVLQELNIHFKRQITKGIFSTYKKIVFKETTKYTYIQQEARYESLH